MATLGFKAKEAVLHDDLDEFNFDDMDFSMEEPPDDRHPVIKNLSSVGRGVKDYVSDGKNIERFVKQAMPPGYGQAYDLLSETKDDLKQLYNGITNEVRPIKETSKRLLKKALPSLDGKIPKKLHKKLEEMAQEEYRYQGRQGDDKESQLNSLLTTIFEQKEEDKLQAQTETSEREKIKQGFEQMRHRSEMGQLDAIRLGIESQVQYQNRISFNVQKKQLELGYRQFWALAELNKEQKRSNAEILTEMKATRKNTALPDFVKQTTHERFKELVRNKFLENAREGMFGGAKDYLRKFTRNLGDQALGTVRNYTNAISGAAGLAEGASGMGEGMPGLDMRDQVIRLLTSLPMDYIANRGAQQASDALGKSSKLRRGGARASHFVNTVGDRAHSLLTDPNMSWGRLEPLREMFANAAPSNTPESRMEVDTLQRSHEPKPFNRANSKSLDEVIPGLLARIHREIKILRTGDEKTELISYDFAKNKFSTEKKIGSDLRQRIAGANADRANKYSNQIVKRLNRGGDLTDSQQELLRKKLIERSVMGESIDSTKVHLAEQWGGGEDGEAIAKVFNKYLKSKDGKLSPDNYKSFDRQIKLLQDHRSIVSGIGDPRVLLQQMVNSGQLQGLKETGILNENNTLDRKVFADWLANKEETPEPPTTAGAPPATRSRKLGRRPAPAAQPPAPTNIQQLAPTTPPGGAITAISNAKLDQIIKELQTISGKMPTSTPSAGGSIGGTVEGNVQTIADLFQKHSDNAQLGNERQAQLLADMLKQLEAIAKRRGNGGLFGNRGGSDTPPDGDDPNNPSGERSYTSLFAHLKDKAVRAFSKGGEIAGTGLGHGKNFWNKHFPTVKQFGSDAAGFAGDKVTNLKNRLSSIYGDVFVNGETVPRLREHLLRAGEYRDKATGKVITSLEDIKGDVIDSAGNVVITLEEFYNGFISGNVRKKVSAVFKDLRSFLDAAVVKAKKYIPMGLLQLKEMGQGLFNKAKSLLPPYDVYVRSDMKRPILYANLMRYDGYVSKKTGKLIKHPRDIDGEVLDTKGNVIVNEQHLQDGLVDINGIPVGKGLQRLANKVAGIAHVGFQALRTAAGAAGSFLSKGFTGVKDYFKDFTVPFSEIVTNSKKSVTLLEQIFKVLDDRLPNKGKKKVRGDMDGDGVRDGSIEDIKAKREKDKKEKQEAAAAKATGSASSGGMLDKLFGGLKNLFGKKKEEGEEEEEGDSLWDKAKEMFGGGGDNDSGGNDAGSNDPRADRRAKAKKRLERMRRAARERARAGSRPGFLRRAGSRVADAGRRLGGSGALGRGASGLAGGAGRLGNRLGGLRRFVPNIVSPTAARGIGAVGSVAGRGIGALGRGTWGAAKLLGRGAGAVGRTLAGDGAIGRVARWGAFNTDIVGGAARGVGALASGAKYLPRALGAAGALYSGYSAYNNFQEGNYGAAAMDAGMGLGGLALSAGGLAGVGGAILGGLGAILGSPLLIPGLAAAAVGYAGYKAYKYFAKTKVTNLSKLRLAQYGIGHEDTETADKIFSLETTLEKDSTIKDGNVYLDEKKVDLKAIGELFGINDKQDLQLFNQWYKRRFVPVFRYWLGQVRKVKQDGELSDIEKIIPAKNKLTVANESITATAEACDNLVGWNKAHQRLSMTADAVKQVLETIRIELAKEAEADGGPAAKAAAAGAVASSTKEATVLAQKALTDKGSYVTKDKDGKVIDASTFSAADLTEKIKKGDITVTVAVALPKNLLHTDASQLDALTTIRFKAYGLTTLSADKSRTLGALENFLSEYTDVDSGDPKLNISSDQILKAAGDVFGVPNNSGEHATRWRAWFNGRFLPVYLLYVGAVRGKTGKKKLTDAVASFPMTEQGALARAIIGAQGVSPSGGKTSIWNITSNPWADNYELNTDSDSTAGNLEAIRLVADKVKLGEVTAKGGKIQETGKANQEKGWWAATKRKVGNIFGIDTSPKGEGVRATGDTLVSKDAKPLAGMGDTVSFSGNGSGNYLDLPKPSGEGWAANKETILKAAAMAGVDPKALIATIAVESGFNPNAAPKNSNLPTSAKGYGQHLDSSWQEDLQRDGKRFGIPNGVNQFDPRASALMTASRLKFNAQALSKAIGRPVTATDLYLAHLMGLGGATKFLKSPETAIGAEMAGAAAKQHPNYFYDKSGKALTVKEVYAGFAAKLAKRPAELGVTDTDMKSSTPPATTTAAQGATSAPNAAGATPDAKGGNATPAAKNAPQVPPNAPTGPATFANTPAAGTPQLNGPVTMEKGKTAVIGKGVPMVVTKGAKYELILQREDSEEDGTYGSLRFPDGTVLNSLELPWKDNQPRVSSIPPGSYECKVRSTSNFGESYEVQGVPGRSAVLIHAGNSAGNADKGMKADSQGCILLGMDRGRKGNQKIITASKPAMKLFMEKMGGQPFTLTIRQGKVPAPTAADQSKTGVNFDPVRASGSGAEVATKAAPTVAFTPSATATASPASTPDTPAKEAPTLPRMNPTMSSFTPGSPSKDEMRSRDRAISELLAPSLDKFGGVIERGAKAQEGSLQVLKEILATMKKEKPEAASTEPSSGGMKAKPVTNTDTPIPQKRKY